MYKSIILILFFISSLNSCSINNKKNFIRNNFPLLVIKNKRPPSILWSRLIDSNIDNNNPQLHLAYEDNIIFNANRKGIIDAINIENGKKKWSIHLGDKYGLFFHHSALLSGGLTVANFHIYVGNEKAQVYSINTYDGSIAWKTTVGGEVISSPTVSNGMVLIHTGNGQLQALNEKNGKIEWTISFYMPILSLRGESSPVTAFNKAVIGEDSGHLSTVLINKGQIIWQKYISQLTIGPNEIDQLNDIDINPIIVDDIIYSVAYNGDFTALDLYNGQIIWKRKLGLVNNFIADDNCIYLIDNEDRLLALDNKNGIILWVQNNLIHHSLTSITLYNDNLIVSDKEGYIYWIDQNNGNIIFNKRIDRSGFFVEPVIIDSKIFVKAKSGMLYAISD